jgi:hypothetical protein
LPRACPDFHRPLQSFRQAHLCAGLIRLGK